MSCRRIRRAIAIPSLMVVLCFGVIRLAGGQALEVPAEADARPRSPGTPVPQPQAEPRVAPPDREYQPPVRPAEPEPQPEDWPELDSMQASRSPIIRLASVPNMFGDSFGSSGQIFVDDYGSHTSSDIPPVGGSRRVKVAENNKALPTDRVFFVYNHFHNALDATSWLDETQSFSVDRYTFGLEKTFRDGLWSVELRMPLVGAYQHSDYELDVDGGVVGNLAVTLKRLLYSSRYTAVAAGLCIDTPTGSDVSGLAGASAYTLHNEAVHLSPFVGFLRTPNERLFYQGFLQVDIAASGNQIDWGGHGIGKLSEQNLLYVDLSWGYWLYRNRCAGCITGVAPVVEYHYATTLQDADVVSAFDYQTEYTIYFGNLENRLDVSNLTVGLHTELGAQTTVRVAGVLPLSDGPDRAFDAEVQVSVNRRF